MSDHLLLVDCSAFAYRAFYSMPALRRQSDGEPTGAVLGFMALMWRMLGTAQADPPTMGAAVFDAPGQNFRHKIMPAYKGNRDPARNLELEKQLPLMRPVAEVLGLTPVEKKGFEADDVIATLAHQAAYKHGIRVTIVSSDKDFGQLVDDGRIEIYDPMQTARDATKPARKLSDDVIGKWGVAPHLVPHVQALCGDSVDNIPGIEGCGPETAARLIRGAGSLDALLKNVDDIRFPKIRAQLKRHHVLASDAKGRAYLKTLPPGVKGKLGTDWVKTFLRLATLKTDVKLGVDFKDLLIQPIMKSHLEQVVRAIDSKANITALFGLDRKDLRLVSRHDDPLDWWREELIAPGQRLPADPQCGFYRARLVRGGPWVAARIWVESYKDPVTGLDSGMDRIFCTVDGKHRDPVEWFTRLAMYPMKMSEFDFETADSAHAKAYRPDDPKADPSKPIDLTKLSAPTNPRAKRTA